MHKSIFKKSMHTNELQEQMGTDCLMEQENPPHSESKTQTLTDRIYAGQGRQICTVLK